jgi:hypothetical protein
MKTMLGFFGCTFAAVTAADDDIRPSQPRLVSFMLFVPSERNGAISCVIGLALFLMQDYTNHLPQCYPRPIARLSPTRALVICPL